MPLPFLGTVNIWGQQNEANTKYGEVGGNLQGVSLVRVEGQSVTFCPWQEAFCPGQGRGHLLIKAASLSFNNFASLSLLPLDCVSTFNFIYFIFQGCTTQLSSPTPTQHIYSFMDRAQIKVPISFDFFGLLVPAPCATTAEKSVVISWWTLLEKFI